MDTFKLVMALFLGLSSAYAGPLHEAAQNGNLNEVRRLIDGGADVNAPGTKGLLPLSFAIRSRNPAVIKEFLDRGANINAKDSRGWTAVVFTISYNLNRPKEILEIFRKWSIENQVRLSNDDLEKLADAGMGTIDDYNRDFAAYPVNFKRYSTEAIKEYLPKGPDSIIHQYLGNQ